MAIILGLIAAIGFGLLAGWYGTRTFFWGIFTFVVGGACLLFGNRALTIMLFGDGPNSAAFMMVSTFFLVPAYAIAFWLTMTSRFRLS